MARKIIQWGSNEDFIKKYEELKSQEKWENIMDVINLLF